MPWRTVNVSKPAKGQQYALTVQYDVADATGDRVGRNQWARGTNDDAGQTRNWGTITLQ